MAVPFGIAFVWLGYAVFYYGYNRITGGNDHFVDLIYPGRYHAVTRDDGSGGSSAASSSSTPAATKAKTTTMVKGPTPNVNTASTRTVGHA